ncbi:MAG: hypothetical protein IJY54_04325 [Paludibacteraceae bacterium]|nr:hypothetical protein [Paludibacteraceae bacterium]
MGYWIDWKNPKTFSEKLQWLKLYDRKPEYTTMVDKFAVKEYVANLIGEEYIIPTLGVWDTPEDINWDELPNQFVLKTTHGGGNTGVVICKDKVTFDKKSAIEKLNRSLKSCIFKSYREWPYKNVKRRIIAEQYMEDRESEDLIDYKFYCFNGEPIYCQVIRDRRSKETIDFYDVDWNHMSFVGLNPIAENSLVSIVKNGITQVVKPYKLEDMLSICSKVASQIPFVRVDLYSIQSKVYMGEITFYPASGLGVFTPKEWNDKLGKFISLPRIDNK